MRLLSLVILTLLASSAQADELVPPPRTGVTKAIPIAVGINFPTGWIDANSIAGSLSIGVSDHDAIRVNAATYRYAHSIGNIISLAAGGDGDESSRSGRISDLGLGFVHYSRGLWEGLSLEVGAFRRANDIRINDANASPATVATTSTIYAGRALVGWSWLIKQHVFIALAVGVSVGLERGTEKTEDDNGGHMMTADLDRSAIAPEGYLRFGGAFDL